ncbi:hypothetical protein OCD70_22990 [Bacillus tropicus]|uniref:hypothetical protein n=1 Tax=Bacillus tropicus TaxID=2026188 RepID=UPI0021CEEF77|nr:hypothetical protein [Bacillus tropicus]MCU5002930.1 hypothetical protein [Bacillus tropicus]
MEKKRVDFEHVKMILLFVSVVIMMLIFAMNVWDDLFYKDDETLLRQEKEREERRIQRMEMIRDIE